MPAPLADYAVLPLPLTPVEAEDLHDYEATIARGLSTFFEVGIALGWKLFEKHESKAALKRAVATWANSPNMIFENHL